MITDITKNHLILLAYNELPDKEHKKLLSAVLKDEELTKEFECILEQMDVLDSLSYTPHPTSVQIVLEESCDTSSLETI